MSRYDDNVSFDAAEAFLESMRRLIWCLPGFVSSVCASLDPGAAARPMVAVKWLAGTMHLTKPIVNADPGRLGRRRKTDRFNRLDLTA